MTKIMVVKNIEKYISTSDANLWDYSFEDIDEAVMNNDYLIVDSKTKRIYEVTEDMFFEIIEKGD